MLAGIECNLGIVVPRYKVRYYKTTQRKTFLNISELHSYFTGDDSLSFPHSKPTKIQKFVVVVLGCNQALRCTHTHNQH